MNFLHKNKNSITKYLLLIVGASILSFGLYNVHYQSNITEGGVLGMTLLINHWTNIPTGIISFTLDATCYLFGFKYLGKQFAKYALVASTAFAISFTIYEQFPPLLPNWSNNPIIAAIVGGLFVGVGVGIIVRIGGASGGDDALALIISKKTGLNIARTYLVTDLVVLVLSLSYIPIIKIACSLITVTLSSFIIGKIHVLSRKKAV